MTLPKTSHLPQTRTTSLGSSVKVSKHQQSVVDFPSTSQANGGKVLNTCIPSNWMDILDIIYINGMVFCWNFCHLFDLSFQSLAMLCLAYKPVYHTSYLRYTWWKRENCCRTPSWCMWWWYQDPTASSCWAWERDEIYRAGFSRKNYGCQCSTWYVSVIFVGSKD